MGRKTTVQEKLLREKPGHNFRKEKLKRETESFLIGAQNNAIRTNYIEAKNDNPLQKSKCRLYGEKDETINHILSGYSKLAQ